MLNYTSMVLLKFNTIVEVKSWALTSWWYLVRSLLLLITHDSCLKCKCLAEPVSEAACLGFGVLSCSSKC